MVNVSYIKGERGLTLNSDISRFKHNKEMLIHVGLRSGADYFALGEQ